MEWVFVRHGEPAWVRDGRGVLDPGLTERGHRQALGLAARLQGEAFDEVWVSPARRARETLGPLAARWGIEPQTHPWLVEAKPPAEVDGMPVEELRRLFGGSRRRPIRQWWAGLGAGDPAPPPGAGTGQEGAPRHPGRRGDEPGEEARPSHVQHPSAPLDAAHGAGPEPNPGVSGGAGGEPLGLFIERVTAGLDARLASWGGAWRVDAPTAPGRPPCGHGLLDGVPKDLRVLVVSHAGTTAVALSHLLGLHQVAWAWERFYLGHAALATARTVPIADGLIFGLRSFHDAEHLATEDRTR